MHLAFSLATTMTMLLLTRTASGFARLPKSNRFVSARFVAAPIVMEHQVRNNTTVVSSNAGPLPVDVDHYTSGWNIEDIGDFTKPGKYNIQTYNKISDVVS